MCEALEAVNGWAARRVAPWAARRAGVVLRGSGLLVLTLMVLAVGGLSAGPAQAAPEPDPVPTRWELDFRPGPLRVATVSTPETGPSRYLFMTYRVTNNSGLDRLFAPSFDLMTDSAEVLRAGRGVPREVTEALLRRLDNPLLQDQLSIVSTLLQGTENSKFGLVVFPLPELDVDELKIFAAGFSGESKPYFTTDPETGERVRHVLRKTRMLRFEVPGELGGSGMETLEPVERRWVMR